MGNLASVSRLAEGLKEATPAFDAVFVDPGIWPFAALDPIDEPLVEA